MAVFAAGGTDHELEWVSRTLMGNLQEVLVVDLDHDGSTKQGGR